MRHLTKTKYAQRERRDFHIQFRLQNNFLSYSRRLQLHASDSLMLSSQVLPPYPFCNFTDVQTYGPFTLQVHWRTSLSLQSGYQISSSFKHDKRINRSPLRYSHKKDQDQQMDFWFLTLILPKQTLRPDQLMPLSQMQLVNTQNHRKKLPLPGKLWGIENNNADYHRNWETVTSP